MSGALLVQKAFYKATDKSICTGIKQLEVIPVLFLPVFYYQN